MKAKIVILLLMMSFCVNQEKLISVKAAESTKTVSVPPNGGWVIHGIYTRSESTSRVYATNYNYVGNYTYCDAICTTNAWGNWQTCSNATYRLYKDSQRKPINLINTVDSRKNICLKLQGILSQTSYDNHKIKFEY
ncbi:MAG: hypothetical protein NC393_02890 [Clostridium sp.]|nr:hypothetical protein [Clostridium sp.]MCM1171053.1 hypothetical protein [Clostridium sp.]MCM1208920.1 hypothetical protein [Ruminococcus sp.]